MRHQAGDIPAAAEQTLSRGTERSLLRLPRASRFVSPSSSLSEKMVTRARTPLLIQDFTMDWPAALQFFQIYF